MKKMKKIFILLFSIFLSTSFFAQKSIDQMSFGTDSTLDIMTWNVEYFPKSGQTTINYVKQIIIALDVDIVAMQEISDLNSFTLMLSDMPGYECVYNPNSYGDQALAYIYKKDVIKKNSVFPIYTESYYDFPRRPFVFDFDFKGENFIIINNHLKAYADGTSVSRRLKEVNLLKDYIDAYYPKKNVIVVGDMNDELTDTYNNVFQSVIDDPQHYKFVDMDIAKGPNDDWSYPNWPSHLDHTLITNELFDEFSDAGSVIEVIKVDDYLSSYERNVSDHRPEATRFLSNLNVAINENTNSGFSFSNYPNPCSISTTFNLASLNQESELEIYNISGQRIISQKINKDQKSVSISTIDLTNGIYFARLLSENKQIADLKFVVNK